jgi:two-component system CheB/CheR fusion protein
LKPTDGDLAGVHVLLVDDTEDVLEMFGSYLRYVGAVVTLARNGSEALACLAQARAHVIVTDLAMPGMGGVEFVARLLGSREQDQAPPPVIAVTAFADHYSDARMAEAGFRSYLVKPVQPARLALEIRRIYDFTYGLEGDGRGA